MIGGMRRRAFLGQGPETDMRYERASKWLLATIWGKREAREWCDKNNISITRAAHEGVGSSGDFLAPQDLTGAIADMREMYGAMRRRARVVPMKSNVAHVPKHSGAFPPDGSSATAASFLQEGNSATSIQIGIDSVGLAAKKIGALVLLSYEVEEDARAIVDFVVNELAWALSAKEDDCAFNGDGTSAYGGIKGILSIANDGLHGIAKVSASSHNTYGTLDQTDLSKVMGFIRASAIPNGAWFVSQQCFAQTFCRLGATGNGYLDYADIEGIRTPLFLGFPVILCQKLSNSTGSLSGKGMLAFGDMYQAAILGERRQMTIGRSAERYLDIDQIGILATERIDVSIHDMGDATNPGALAVLFGA